MGSHLLRTQASKHLELIQFLHFKSEEAVGGPRMQVVGIPAHHFSLSPRCHPKETLDPFLPLLESGQTHFPEGILGEPRELGLLLKGSIFLFPLRPREPVHPYSRALALGLSYLVVVQVASSPGPGDGRAGASE